MIRCYNMLPKLEMITDISRGIYYIGGPEYHPKRKKLKGYQKNRK